MILLADLGNSRAKLARYENGVMADIRHVGYAPDWIDTLLEDAPELPAQVYCSNVAGEPRGAEFVAGIRERCGRSVQFAKTEREAAGVVCAYPQPERLGVDRWLALIAGYHRREVGDGAVCVADCGTAITFDVVNPDGQHIGGLIAPGIHRAYASLAGQASGIPAEPAPEAGGDWLAADTASAVASGALQSVLGLLDRMARQLQEVAAAGLSESSPRLILTGGDAPLLQPLLDANWELQPALVLEGLLKTLHQ